MTGCPGVSHVRIEDGHPDAERTIRSLLLDALDAVEDGLAEHPAAVGLMMARLRNLLPPGTCEQCWSLHMIALLFMVGGMIAPGARDDVRAMVRDDLLRMASS